MIFHGSVEVVSGGEFLDLLLAGSGHLGFHLGLEELFRRDIPLCRFRGQKFVFD